ncbi:MAG: 4-hydroxythreonine-4-phosphate dehydrogenase PdxA, partial [Candidatus Cloacimonetes bacterium]|nr:4-hydroxythreonine-4-phosphate dehydrogenase PdxA [Candidatus Cloacimonadota bacterium]
MKKIAITTGDPAGIGIELTSRIVRFFLLPKRLIIIVYGSIDQYPDGNMVRQITSPAEAISPGIIYWIKIEDPRIKPGKPSSLSGKIALEILSRCAADLNSGKLDGVVTCPVSKEFIRQTKNDFIGHTEFFADTANNPEVVMSFWSDKFILALLTTHLAICDLHQILTPELIESRIRLIFAEISKLRPGQHRFACLGVNPHAGEQGAFGAEDEMIGEILKKLAREDINIDGPFPADTFFAYHAGEYDVVISAYHDQGLIPFKMLNRDEGVNVTLGLPFIRTSVDHGTAFDLAGTGKASDKSLLKALNLAMEMVGVKSPKTPVYDNFAPFYDHYMAHVNYQSWIKIILQHYNKRFKKTPAEILELACGTCNISCLLVKKGMSVDAWDNSSEMLKIASRKP